VLKSNVLNFKIKDIDFHPIRSVASAVPGRSTAGQVSCTDWQINILLK
jgi:hypothetical protein